MDYATLLAAAQADPVNADFHALRMAYARSEGYAPYNHHPDEVLALNAALRDGELDQARAAVDALLAFNYLDIEAHMAADYLCTQREDHAGAAYHRAWARGLLAAILATGTGRDPGSAWMVLSTTEEYTILNVLGFATRGQRLIGHDNHWVDLQLAQHRASGQQVELYFNVDLPLGWLHRHSPAVPPAGEGGEVLGDADPGAGADEG